MYDVLEQFIDFFQLDGLLDGSISSVSGFLGITILAFFGLIFTVIGISPGNLDCSLYFNQPSISYDVLCI